MPLTIELPERDSLTEFDLRRWDEILTESVWQRIPGRVETNRFGQVLMSPPPSHFHSSFMFRIAKQIESLLPEGNTLPECPISTSDGVRAADVGWFSEARFRPMRNAICFEVAPEICGEVLSPSNTRREMIEKTELSFEAGAEEVWLCDAEGPMAFEGGDSGHLEASLRCPDFPMQISPL